MARTLLAKSTPPFQTGTKTITINTDYTFSPSPKTRDSASYLFGPQESEIQLEDQVRSFETNSSWLGSWTAESFAAYQCSKHGTPCFPEESWHSPALGIQNKCVCPGTSLQFSWSSSFQGSWRNWKLHWLSVAEISQSWGEQTNCFFSSWASKGVPCSLGRFPPQNPPGCC